MQINVSRSEAKDIVVGKLERLNTGFEKLSALVTEIPTSETKLSKSEAETLEKCLQILKAVPTMTESIASILQAMSKD